MTEPNETLEFWKANIEYLKHLSTLSTGSIVLIATFLDKLFTQPIWKVSVIISLVGFLVSVISSVVAYTLIMHYEFPGSDYIEININRIGRTVLYFTWTGFLVGIASLAIFAVVNLL